MRDCNGVLIRQWARVEFQFERDPKRPALPGTVLDADSHRAKELNAVLFKGDGVGAGPPQFIGGEHLRVLGPGE